MGIYDSAVNEMAAQLRIEGLPVHFKGMYWLQASSAKRSEVTLD